VERQRHTGQVQKRVGRRSSIPQKLVYREADIFSDLAKQDWGNVSIRMERHRCASSIGVAELFVRTPLPNLLKADALKNSCDFLGFQDRN
jgi:hypothetical protein